MKIAIIGSGIAGNVIAHHLNKTHDITVFEKNSHIGGHTHTHSVQDKDGISHNIDTGFIVLNDRTYPNFNALLSELDIAINKTEMSFSVKCDRTGLEYNGNNIDTLFAQRRNLVNPVFYRLIMDILRFNRQATDAVVNETLNDQTISLGQYLESNRYSDIFINKYIIPMGAAIWSTRLDDMLAFPALFFFRFFHNHGLLTVNNRPQWYVIDNGSRQYVDKLVKPFADKVRTNCPVSEISRDANGVTLKGETFGTEHFDYVFIASHSDQALAMLADATPDEQKTLSAIEYQANQAVLHTDAGVLPKRKKAWASWNYHITNQENKDVCLTYNMNILQGIESSETFCVSLNDTGNIREDKIIKTVSYEHPIFSIESIAAQQQHRAINGTRNTYYCGAYWRNGFHEDGVVSALTALEHFQQDMDNEQLSLRRAS
jgi:predicted NAD/FAD-binding protein